MSRCKCTRCELVRLGMLQVKETGRLDGVTSRVGDLVRENDHLKKENTEIKSRLFGLECTSRELQGLAENFRQSYKSKKTHKSHKRKIVPDMKLDNRVPPKNSDPVQDSCSSHVVLEVPGPGVPGVPEVPFPESPFHWAVQESQHGSDGETDTPGVPA